MADHDGFRNPREQTLVRYGDRFALTLSLTKICARSCGVFRSDNASSRLSEVESDCLGKNYTQHL